MIDELDYRDTQRVFNTIDCLRAKIRAVNNTIEKLEQELTLLKELLK